MTVRRIASAGGGLDPTVVEPTRPVFRQLQDRREGSLTEYLSSTPRHGPFPRPLGPNVPTRQGVTKVKPRNVLIAVPILAAAVFAGLKGYLHYTYESLLNEAIQNASPFVELRYDDLSTTFDGDLIIKGITVTPRAEFTDTVRIGSVHYDTPGVLYLLTNRDRLEQGEFPSHVRLEIRGLEVPLDGFIAGALDKSTEAENVKLDGQITPFCGDAHYLTSRHYAEMGYKSWVSDISLGYEFKKHSQLIHIALTWATRGIGSLALSADLSGVTSTSAQTLMASGPPSLSRVELIYGDDSYVSRILEYCAGKRQMTREELIQAEVNAEPEYYAATWGILPGQALLQAYQRFLESPAEVRVVMHTDTIGDLATLSQYRKTDLPALLNMQVYVNGEVVDDLSFSEPAIRPANRRRSASGRDGTQVSSGKARSAPPPTPQYHAVRAEELSEHVGRNVRIHTVGGAVREGRLSGVRNHKIYAMSRVYGGKMEVIVPVDQANRIEVYYAKVD